VLLALNKPWGVLCQFTDRTGRRTLAEFVRQTDVYPAGRLDFDSEGRDAAPGACVEAHAPRRRAPAQGGAGRRHAPGTDPWRRVYPAGRLDFDSEGLLLLTDDGALARRISDPCFHLPKTYLVQVEREPAAAALEALARGVLLNDGLTRPAAVRRVEPPPWLWPRDPPVRHRKTVPDAWLELTIREGRNRQVRRMTAAVGHPTLRLIRVAIGPWALGDLAPGATRRLDEGQLPALAAARSAPRPPRRSGR
jgi:23S rRNA pseudouridine2457 synthase